jgi:hypothetical protein
MWRAACGAAAAEAAFGAAGAGAAVLVEVLGEVLWVGALAGWAKPPVAAGMAKAAAIAVIVTKRCSVMISLLMLARRNALQDKIKTK